MRIWLLLSLLLCSLALVAQAGNPATSEGSLEKQFDEMVQASNRYQRFRVVRQDFLNAYAANVADSIAGYTTRIGELNNRISALEARIEQTASDVADRDGQIQELTEEKDTISLLGIPMSKTAYSTLMWALVILLGVLLLLAIGRARVAVAGTDRLEHANEKLNADLEQSRKRRLEVEQSLRRELQDERNRNRG